MEESPYDLKEIAKYVSSKTRQTESYSQSIARIGLKNVKKSENMEREVYENIKRYFSQWSDQMNVELAKAVVEAIYK